MDHVAIMKKEWELMPKILSGEKTIESRWYKAKVAPWDRISAGDTVYFKNSGEPVAVKAEVAKVEQYESYDDKELREIVDKYGGVGKINFVFSSEDVYEWARERKYCILIFLEDAQQVEPFGIGKTGYGSACAWMCVGDINKVKI